MTEQINEAAWQLAHHLNTAPERPTLRDQFAMAALTGLLASEEFHSLTTAAKMSYAFADAMMAERNKTAPPVEVKGP